MPLVGERIVVFSPAPYVKFDYFVPRVKLPQACLIDLVESDIGCESRTKQKCSICAARHIPKAEPMRQFARTDIAAEVSFHVDCFGISRVLPYWDDVVDGIVICSYFNIAKKYIGALGGNAVAACYVELARWCTAQLL